MRFLNHWLEIVTTIEIDGAQHEVCASVMAHHDQVSQELVLYRDTFARRADNFGPEEYYYPEWLPEPGVIKLVCPAASAARMAEQHFTDWMQDVRSRIPNVIADESLALCTGSD